eukprot:sb/3461740/
MGWNSVEPMSEFFHRKQARYHKKCKMQVYRGKNPVSDPEVPEALLLAVQDFLIKSEPPVVSYPDLLRFCKERDPEIPERAVCKMVDSNFVSSQKNNVNTFVCHPVRLHHALSHVISDTNNSSYGPLIQEIREDITKFRSRFKGKIEDIPDPPKSLTDFVGFLINGEHGLPTTKVTQQISAAVLYSQTSKESLPRERESRPILETSLRTYLVAPKKNLASFLNSVGIVLPYHRLRELVISCAQMAENTAQLHQGYVPLGGYSNCMTIYGMDNLDQNQSWTFKKEHFHGSVYTAIQFVHENKIRVRKAPFVEVKKFVRKRTEVNSASPHIPESYRYPLSLVNPEFNDEELKGLNENAMNFVRAWLKEDVTVQFAEYGQKCPQKAPYVEVGTFPLISDTINSHTTVRTIVDRVLEIHKNLSQSETIAIVCDQPVFQRLQELIMENRSLYCNVFPILGGLHIQKAILISIGKVASVSGLQEQLNAADMSIAGAGNQMVSVDNIASSHFIILCLSKVLYDLYFESPVPATPNPYWRFLLYYCMVYLALMGAMRKGDYHEYIGCLHLQVNMFFALNRLNYARWTAVHLEQLLRLKFEHPDLHEHFCAGGFVGRKTSRAFSGMALDQLYEQSNKFVKQHSGTLGGSSSRIWQLAAPELHQMLESTATSSTSSDYGDDHVWQDHHSVGRAGRNRFKKNVDAVRGVFGSNPFHQARFTRLNDNVCLDIDGSQCIKLTSLVKKGGTLYRHFRSTRLTTGEVELTATLSRQTDHLPDFLVKDATKAPQRAQNNVLIRDLKLAITYRPEQLLDVLEDEVEVIPSCFRGLTTTELHWAQKSDLLKQLRKVGSIEAVTATGALIIDLSAVTRIVFYSKKEELTDYSSAFVAIWRRIKEQRLAVGSPNILHICLDDYTSPNLLKSATHTIRAGAAGSSTAVQSGPDLVAPDLVAPRFSDRINIE